MSKTIYVDQLLLEQQAKEVWQRDPAIREEFDQDFDSYHAFRRAEARGGLRIYGQPRLPQGDE